MVPFCVGQKVVCVDDALLGRDDGILTKGHVYTIRAIGPAQGRQHPARRHDQCSTAVWLHEVRRAMWGDDPELGFLASRFRPLVNTDISVFTAMLAPMPKQARELETTP